MTHSTPAQTTHTTAHQSPVSIKNKAGSPKPDMSQKTVKEVIKAVKLASIAIIQKVSA